MSRIAIAYSLGHVYVTPDGVAHDTRRIGERRDGVTVSTAEMSDAEIDEAGLTGKVRPASADANRLFPPARKEP